MSCKKKDKILMLAMEEFGKKGYEAASTNQIAKNAQVAKGLIFHYFKDKENLYYETYKMVLGQTLEEFNKFVESHKNDDPFDMMKAWAIRKVQLSYEKPEMVDFLATLMSAPDHVKTKIVSDLRELQTSFFNILFEKIQKLNLRDGITAEIAIKFIVCLFRGLTEVYFEVYRSRPENIKQDVKKLLDESNAMIDIIKHGIVEK
ncbi:MULTISPECIES: TetR/AcrR family transcriptional regulator [Pseudothermotoga]|jgi:AcrR family transcriptional regulator|uniref:Transcriptional regulator, TetR family n=3 Tax=Pseudothermotoga TaxID=1643951 RepID=A8F8D0_PSELT|nr:MULTISPECIES: TetR/AcrR family transcriptional regulator [Pseudothermotoga]ABV34414.1 transcriptional regulator, TetR family [Pseudothermotoga lettingae TMO]KUK21734.1 MAG: Transcriptional regulator, TetR family [Pseudothermotoga lettingae]MDI3494341.1 TetR/AcrR family transcriptional regulator [Pseudothermotoga sp.]MDK2883640.1 TetR/AcrR family transcriptional regulator [Pseudothermotoga sp.]GLI48641.1 TetR family transcriptional regulator [Pseudothermotoga lettingae TMO]